MSESVELTCPQCERTFTADVWLIVDAAARPDLLERIRAGALHDVPCPHCGHEGTVDVPLLLYRPQEEPVVLFSPARATSSEQDCEQAAGLVGVLQERLGDAWRDAWLTEGLTDVPRDLLPATLIEGFAVIPEEMNARIEKILVEFGELGRALVACMNAPTWSDTRQVIKENPVLLNEETDALIANLLAVETRKRVRHALEQHRALLRRCRQVGVEQAFAERTGGMREEVQTPWELLQAFLAADNLADSRRVLEQRPDLLCSEAGALLDQMLDQLIGAQDDEDAIAYLEQHRALLHSYQAEIHGSGAIAQGDGAVAAGERGVAAHDIHGRVVTGDGAGQCRLTRALRRYIEEIHFDSERAKRKEALERYSDVSFPGHTVVQHIEALRVAITLEPTSERAAELTLEPPSDEEEIMKVDACLMVSALDFDLESPNVQTIEVPLDADSDPVIFKLRPKSVGRKTIGVEFFQDTRYLGRAEVETTVGERVRESHPVSAHSTLALRPQQLAPDLTIYIEEASLEKEHRLYRFLLLSPIHEIDLNFEEAGEIELQAPPEIYFEELFAELNDWLRERDVDDDLFSKRLSSLGANLYDQLFPEKLKRIYWEKLRDKVETVQIISADPWIPWELVRPYHPETLEEDDFLCEQFALTRWLTGSSSPDVIDLQKLALVVAASGLSAAADEAEALRKLPGIEVKDVPPSLLDVYDLLETGGFQGVHFACHGEYDRQNPDQSIVLLESGQRFRPNDIAGKKRTFGRDEPLVFLNACETGRAGLSLTGLGGWAKAFIGAGAGGFVGSTWQAHDESAYKFAVAFYGYLLEGETVAEAARLARREIRRAGDPTWLSYTVYANPLARLTMESKHLEQRTPPDPMEV